MRSDQKVTTLHSDPLVTELKKLQQRRLRVNFVDDEDDDSNKSMQKTIDQMTNDITDVSIHSIIDGSW